MDFLSWRRQTCFLSICHLGHHHHDLSTLVMSSIRVSLWTVWVLLQPLPIPKSTWTPQSPWHALLSASHPSSPECHGSVSEWPQMQCRDLKTSWIVYIFNLKMPPIWSIPFAVKEQIDELNSSGVHDSFLAMAEWVVTVADPAMNAIIDVDGQGKFQHTRCGCLKSAQGIFQWFPVVFPNEPINTYQPKQS